MPLSMHDEDSVPRDIITVALLEDDTQCRLSMVEAIEGRDDMRVAWHAATLDEARQKDVDSLDVLLVDLGLPDGSGLDMIASMRRTQPHCAVMVSTVFADDDHLLAAVRAGALGYLLKDLPAHLIAEEIRSLHHGGSPINPRMARKLLQYQLAAGAANTPEPTAPASTAPKGDPDLRLSARESEVLHLAARGHTLDEVATKMGITRHTARSFIRRIYQKLQVGSRAEAVSAAMKRGLLDER